MEGVAAELVAEFPLVVFDSVGHLRGVEGVAPVGMLGGPVEAGVGVVAAGGADVEGVEGEVVVQAVRHISSVMMWSFCFAARG